MYNIIVYRNCYTCYEHVGTCTQIIIDNKLMYTICLAIKSIRYFTFHLKQIHNNCTQCFCTACFNTIILYKISNHTCLLFNAFCIFFLDIHW